MSVFDIKKRGLSVRLTGRIQHLSLFYLFKLNYLLLTYGRPKASGASDLPRNATRITIVKT